MENLFPDINRRVFVKGLGWISIGLVMGTMGGCEELAKAIKHRPIRRRLRTGSAEVDADIATYKEAVELMKALPASDPRSWTAQAGIHGSIATGFLYCQHGTNHFFDWHRAYLLYFEKICQKLTKNKKFGLPYWNWNQNPDINPAFLNSSSALFLARTRNTMTGSWSVTTPSLDPILADTNFFTFRQQLEGNPHNTVHCYIGATMCTGGSAIDPVFWTHHCMIDYCWAKWNIELGNNNTNDPTWVNTINSHFVDEDGNPVTATAGATTIMPLIDYQYESSAIGSSPAVETGKTKKEYQKLEKRIKEGADIRFDIKQRIRIMERTTISIAKPVSIQTKLTAGSFANIIDNPSASEKMFLNIGFAQLPLTSDFAVRVFINLPQADSKTGTDDPHFAGSFAFFGAPGSRPSTSGGNEHHPEFLVNITNVLRNLRNNQSLTDTSPLSVQLVAAPFGEQLERADTTLLLEKIDIITTPVIVNSRQ